MSQIIKNLASGPVPPAVPTSFVTNDGTATPDLNVLQVLGVNSTESDDDGILTRANPPSNLVEIVLTNRLFGGGSTAGALTTDIITFPLAATAKSYIFEFKIIGREATSGDTVGYTIFGSAKTNGLVASIVETPYVDVDQDPALLAASIAFIASGNSVILQVTGVAATNITYKALGTYIEI
jgi:hypothetical protein